MKHLFVVVILFCSILGAPCSLAQEGFADGPLIKEFGRHAAVNLTQPLNQNSAFKIAFDVSQTAGDGQLNRKFDSLARFLNMHVANGVNPKNIQLALVVHGKAGFDLLNAKQHSDKFDNNNENLPLIQALLENNVEIYLCGQSAAYYGIENQHLIEGVTMSLSAMTANAQLSQRGFTQNPF